MKLIFSLLLYSIVLGACSSSIDPPANIPADYTLQEGDGVAVAAPADWVSFVPTDEDYQAVADTLRNTGNDMLANRIDNMAQDLADGTFLIAAFHDDGITSFNITSESVPPFINTARQATDNRRGLEDFGYTLLEDTAVEINGNTFERSEFEITLSQSNGSTLTMVLLQYTIVTGNRAYSVSFGTPRYSYADFEPDFEQIIRTFHTIKD